MTKRSQSIIHKLYPLCFLAILLFAWWLVCELSLVPAFMLPSPGKVLSALWNEAPRLWENALVSLQEAFIGLLFSVLASFLLAVLMDRFRFLYQALYPVLVVTQTIPVIAIAPLLVLWLGYGTLPKVVLVFSACFFPLVVGVLSGFASVDRDVLRLMSSMGATRRQILFQVKLPSSLDSFFAGLRISVAYSVVSAVVAEWLGGEAGLGVYMTRVRKAYAFDKMFAVIFLISALSLVLMKLVDLAQKKMMPWKIPNKEL